jgi:hypothetical protein
MEDDYFEKRINPLWTHEERVQFLEGLLLDCPIKASQFGRVLSDSSYEYKVKYRNVKGVRTPYLEVIKLCSKD